MKKIGLLSDTHGYLDPKVFTHFKDCDELWHAGDIGTLHLLEELERFKAVRGVYGNIDDKAIQSRLPEDLRFYCEGIDVWITHIGGSPPNYNPRVRSLLKKNAPDLFICGHSHMLSIKRDPTFNNMLYLNPGAAGNQGFHKIKTLVRFEIHDKKIEKMEVIELGKRGVVMTGDR
jgi:uncharacterized protein